MENLSKIKRVSKNIYSLLSVLLVLIPSYYFIHWVFINYFHEPLFTVNTTASPLVLHKLTLKVQIIGFIASLMPVSALVYCLLNVRKLFSYYKEGIIFSFEHVSIFKNMAKALLWWAMLSIVYESIKSILFSLGNPPGERIIAVGLEPDQIMAFMLGGVIFVIAWVMDEGRILSEENKLTV